MGHPYAEAVLGDFEEECARVADRYGPSLARSWYWWQLVRSAGALTRLTRLDGRGTVRLVGTAVAAYAAALTLLRVVSPVIVHVVAARGLRFEFAYGAMVFVTGGLAGYVTTRASAPRAIAGALLFLALTLSAGAVHVATAVPAEFGFRVVKVATLAAAACAGGLRGASRRVIPAV